MPGIPRKSNRGWPGPTKEAVLTGRARSGGPTMIRDIVRRDGLRHRRGKVMFRLMPPERAKAYEPMREAAERPYGRCPASPAHADRRWRRRQTPGARRCTPSAEPLFRSRQAPLLLLHAAALTACACNGGAEGGVRRRCASRAASAKVGVGQSTQRRRVALAMKERLRWHPRCGSLACRCRGCSTCTG